MNAPDRYERFVVPEGTKKVSYERVLSLFRVDTASNLFTTITIDEPTPGLKTIFNFRVPDQRSGKPVVQFAAGGIATPADAAMMMQLGCYGVVIESEIFDSADPFNRARAIVQAVRHYNDAHVLAESCSILADSMADLNLGEDNVEQIANEETC